jgi:hypothetical protein
MKNEFSMITQNMGMMLYEINVSAISHKNTTAKIKDPELES